MSDFQSPREETETDSSSHSTQTTFVPRIRETLLLMDKRHAAAVLASAVDELEAKAAMEGGGVESLHLRPGRYELLVLNREQRTLGQLIGAERWVAYGQTWCFVMYQTEATKSIPDAGRRPLCFDIKFALQCTPQCTAGSQEKSGASCVCGGRVMRCRLIPIRRLSLAAQFGDELDGDPALTVVSFVKDKDLNVYSSIQEQVHVTITDKDMATETRDARLRELELRLVHHMSFLAEAHTTDTAGHCLSVAVTQIRDRPLSASDATKGYEDGPLLLEVRPPTDAMVLGFKDRKTAAVSRHLTIAEAAE